MHIPLTHKERGFLEFLEAYILREGVAPSYQEIKDHFGYASFNSVQRYIKQLQRKGYISLPGDNQKRALTLLKPSTSLQDHLESYKTPTPISHSSTHPRIETSADHLPESLSLPLLGRVAAGRPVEAMEYDEFVDVPRSLIRHADKSFALRVQGDSMIEDGIFDGDIILVQEQKSANSGETVVATVDNEATVKKFFVHKNKRDQQIELRPANSSMESFWYSPEEVDLRGIVVGLIRKF